MSNADFVGTGYGNQTETFVKRIDGLGRYRVIVCAYYGIQGSSTQYNGHLILPCGQDAYGSDIIAAHVERTAAKAVIALMDAWVLDRGQIRDITERMGVPVFCWLPIDTKRLSEKDEQFLRESGAFPVAMSKHGQRQLIARGLECAYVPHGVDCEIFKPPADRDALRAKFNLTSRFTIGAAQTNKDQVRKSWPEIMEAVRIFADRHPEANTMLAAHALRAAPTGLNLLRMAERKGIARLISFTDSYALIIGQITQPLLADWYGSCDVVIAPSYGEGFGLAILESQACGTPVIVNDTSAMTELCGAGWKVNGQKFWNEHHGEDWQVPFIDYQCPECGHAEGIAAALEAAWEASRDTDHMAAMRQEAREFAKDYDADLVLQRDWVPTLKKLESMTRGATTLRPLERDRDATLARLQDAFNAGNLDAGAFGERAQKALAASAGEDLAALVADLPEAAVAA